MLESSAVGFSRTDPTLTTHDRLRFRGGLLLRSSDPDFGGLSALLVSSDGANFVAVSDQSHWVTGTLEYDHGDLARAAGGWIAPMLDLGGKPLADKAGDAEGLASAEDGNLEQPLFVSFEGNHRVWRYAFGESSLRAVPVELPIPPEVRKSPRNGGLEGITRVADGMLFAVTERFRDHADNYHAWMLPFPVSSMAPHRRGPSAPGVRIAPADASKPRALSVHPLPPFAMTDVRQLPSGDLVTLERRYDPVDGLGVQMRRIPLESLQRGYDLGPAAPLDGELIASLDSSFEIDNMEGLAVRRGDQGETLVYLVSDDNFNRPIQRTLLMMFELLR